MQLHEKKRLWRHAINQLTQVQKWLCSDGEKKNSLHTEVLGTIMHLSKDSPAALPSNARGFDEKEQDCYGLFVLLGSSENTGSFLTDPQDYYSPRRSVATKAQYEP